MSELARRGALLIGDAAMAPPPLASLRRRARRYRLRRRLQAGVAAAAAAAAAAGGIGWASAGSGPAPQALAYAGPLQELPATATAAVPAGPARVPGRPGTWRVASYITEPPSWSRGNGGPPAGGDLSCPQAGTCYFAGPAGGNASGPVLPLSVLYVSRDGGVSWTAIRMPGDASFTTALECPAAGDCLAGGEVAGQGVLLASSDGGYHWSYRALPSGDGVISQLVCPTATSCRALAASSATSSALVITQTLVPPRPTWFLSTDDAGARWNGYQFPDGSTMQALSCLSAADCVAAGGTPSWWKGSPAGASGPQPPTELWTSDGGRTWAAGSLPAGLTLSNSFPGSVACAGTSTCYAVGISQRWPNYFPVGAAAVSTDAGATWRMLTLPPDTPQPIMGAVSCPDALDCWIAGGQAVSQTIPAGGGSPGEITEYSPMILSTSDGGTTWAKATFAAGPLLPGQQAISLMIAGNISCPAVSSCVAIGVADEGSDNTPVYTTAGG